MFMSDLGQLTSSFTSVVTGAGIGGPGEVLSTNTTSVAVDYLNRIDEI